MIGVPTQKELIKKLYEALDHIITDAEERGETRNDHGELYTDFKTGYKALEKAKNYYVKICT